MGQSASQDGGIVMTPTEAAIARKVSIQPSRRDDDNRYRPLPDHWREDIPHSVRDLALEFNRCMSQPPASEFEWVTHTEHSLSQGPNTLWGGPGGSFTTTCMTPRVCDDFADALKRAQWPVDRVEKEQWGCHGIQPYSCRIVWKKPIDKQ
jgi:hypothetical protein